MPRKSTTPRPQAIPYVGVGVSIGAAPRAGAGATIGVVLDSRRE